MPVGGVLDDANVERWSCPYWRKKPKIPAGPQQVDPAVFASARICDALFVLVEVSHLELDVHATESNTWYKVDMRDLLERPKNHHDC